MRWWDLSQMLFHKHRESSIRPQRAYGFACFTMTHAVGSIKLANAFSAASMSAILLNDNALPVSCNLKNPHKILGHRDHDKRQLIGVDFRHIAILIHVRSVQIIFLDIEWHQHRVPDNWQLLHHTQQYVEGSFGELLPRLKQTAR